MCSSLPTAAVAQERPAQLPGGWHAKRARPGAADDEPCDGQPAAPLAQSRNLAPVLHDLTGEHAAHSPLQGVDRPLAVRPAKVRYWSRREQQ